MATIKPLLDKVVATVEKQSESTRGGLILAGKAKEQPIIAKVVSRGPGGMVDGKEVKMYINPGDKILVNKYSGTEITVDGEDYIILRQSDILAFIE